MTYYLPGCWFSFEYMKEVGKAAKQYGDVVKFMFVNTKNNGEYLRQKDKGKHLIVDS